MTQFSDELNNALGMALCDPDALSEFESGMEAIMLNDCCLAYTVVESTACVANATYTGSYQPIVIPGGTFLKGFVIVGNARLRVLF